MTTRGLRKFYRITRSYIFPYRISRFFGNSTTYYIESWPIILIEFTDISNYSILTNNRGRRTGRRSRNCFRFCAQFVKAWHAWAFGPSELLADKCEATCRPHLHMHARVPISGWDASQQAFLAYSDLEFPLLDCPDFRYNKSWNMLEKDEVWYIEVPIIFNTTRFCYLI